MSNPASAALLGELGVDVGVNLAKLLGGFDQAATAADRFDKMLADRVGRSTKNAQSAIDALGAAEHRLMRSFDSAGAAAQRYGRDVTTAQTKTAAAGRQIESSATNIKRVLLSSAGAIAAAFGASEIVKLADSYTSFTNRLSAAGIEGDHLAETQLKLFNIAQHYGVQLDTVGNLFSRLSQASGELGASQGQVMKAVLGASAAVRVYGADTVESNGALLQLSQMLGDVNVRAQEFNSVNQGARPILTAVANGIDRFHGSIAKLRSEVNNGNVSSKEFFAGWLKGMGATIAQADKLPLTIGASFTTLNNALGRYIGQTNEAWSATQRLGAAIAALANNLDTIMPILSSIAILIGSKYAAALGVATASTIRKMAADVAAAAAAAFLANSTGRVTTTLGAANAINILTTGSTARLGAAFTGAGVAAAVAAGSVTRLQVVMGTAGAVATALGSSLLKALGGWVGIAIMAIVGSIYLYQRSVAAARVEIEDFNKHQRKAKDLLAEEAQNARQAGGQIKALGNEHQTATGYVTAFAGATGDAADALHRQAEEARNARVEMLKTAAAQARQDQQNAESRQRALSASAASEGGAALVKLSRGGNSEYEEAGRRASAAKQTAERLEAAAAAAGSRPLESYISPNTQTAGRDIPGEIKQYQTQLVAANAAHNETAQRQLLAEIKLRQRILELMKQGLSLEIAQSTAQAEKLGRAPRETEATTEFVRPVRGGTITGTMGERRPGHTHAGVDIAIPVGTRVGAAAAGTVVEVGTIPGYGNVIIIDHGHGTTTRYAHLSSMLVAKGQRVEADDEIGRSGGARGAAGAGNSRGPHLHYEVRRGGRAVDPFKAGGFPTDDVAAANDAERIERERIQHEEQFNREAQGLNDNILDARRDQTVDAAVLAQLEKDRINAEHDREKQETLNRKKRGEYTKDQADAILLANENLRTLQLHGVDLKEQERKEKESNQLQDATQERLIDQLKAQQDIARTAAERRTIERRILKAQEDYERALLEAKIKSPFTSPIDKLLAQGALANLGRKYDSQRDVLGNQSRDDLMGMDKGLGNSRFATDAAIEEVRREQDERLKIVQDALEAKVISEQDAADRVVEINREGNAKILDIELARRTTTIQAAQSMAESLEQISAAIFGQHSKAARAMFIVSKAFSTAEAIMQLQVAIAKAMASAPFPANLPAIAQAVALGATIIGNIASITAQFDTGGWTGNGPRNRPAGTVHGQEFVVRAGPAAQHRDLLETINAGRDPTRAVSGGGSMGRLSVTVNNHAPGVEHEAYQIGPGEVEIIARKVVQREAPGVVAADMGNPSGRTSKALARHTSARRTKR